MIQDQVILYQTKNIHGYFEKETKKEKKKITKIS